MSKTRPKSSMIHSVSPKVRLAVISLDCEKLRLTTRVKIMNSDYYPP